MTEVLTSAILRGWRNGATVSERLSGCPPMIKRGHDGESAASIRKWRAAMEHYAGIAGMAFDGPSRRKQSEEPVPLRDVEP
jgi:hypothetical protein